MERVTEFQDMLNARQCEVIAACAGVKNVKPSDFLILPKRQSNDLVFDTPDQIARKMSMIGI